METALPRLTRLMVMSDGLNGDSTAPAKSATPHSPVRGMKLIVPLDDTNVPSANVGLLICVVGVVHVACQLHGAATRRFEIPKVVGAQV